MLWVYHIFIYRGYILQFYIAAFIAVIYRNSKVVMFLKKVVLTIQHSEMEPKPRILLQLKIVKVKAVDNLGISYIEAGNPSSNPKDIEFFKWVKDIGLKHAKISAFGSTRRVNIPVEEDSNVLSLLAADTPVVTIFGKSWDFHVDAILKTTLEENLKMIYDTISFLQPRQGSDF